MPLVRLQKPVRHSDFLYELKYDGFRALAYIDGHHCQLISRRRHVYKSWPYLCTELAHAVRCDSAVIDGEIVCLGADGRSRFNDLLFRREWPYFAAFDLLWVDGEDLRSLPLITRKRRLRTIMPKVLSRVLYVDYGPGRGRALFRAACKNGLEGIVAKWRHGTYQAGHATSWLKSKNPAYSQMEGRHELFERRARSSGPHASSARLILA
jgi:bifunctional non-homologous end joining protein LigD